MFGLFKRKEQPTPADSGKRLIGLCELYDDLTNDVVGLYSDFDGYNPAELRFFSISAVSVFIQAYGQLSHSEMRTVVDKFVEQCVGSMLFYMPKAEYSQVHNAFIARFGHYSSLIVNVENADTTQQMQDANFALVTAMDTFIGVERDAISKAMTGLYLSAQLTDSAINTRDLLVN